MKITLLCTILPLQLLNFVLCGRPSRMSQNFVTVRVNSKYSRSYFTHNPQIKLNSFGKRGPVEIFITYFKVNYKLKILQKQVNLYLVFRYASLWINCFLVLIWNPESAYHNGLLPHPFEAFHKTTKARMEKKSPNFWTFPSLSILTLRANVT